VIVGILKLHIGIGGGDLDGDLDGKGSLQILPGKSSCEGILGSGFVAQRVIFNGSLSTRASTRDISEFDQELRGS